MKMLVTMIVRLMLIVHKVAIVGATLTILCCYAIRRDAL